MQSVLIQVNAKINLDLKILGKRADGYHQIKSIIQSVDLSDFLLLEKLRTKASDVNILTGAIVCPQSENIILKAKEVLEKTLNKKLPCQIHLQKSIPIAAGLGGGSADAAAALFGLNLLYNLNLSKKELAAIGIKVGADLPFFFYGGTCKIEGIGEKITPLKKAVSKFFVLFRPHKRLETKIMYKLSEERNGKSFFELTKELCPDVKKLEKYLKNFSLNEFGLSGSGPTIFCGINDYKLAEKISQGYSKCSSIFNGDIFICQPQKQALKVIRIE